MKTIEEMEKEHGLRSTWPSYRFYNRVDGSSVKVYPNDRIAFDAVRDFPGTVRVDNCGTSVMIFDARRLVSSKLNQINKMI